MFFFFNFFKQHRRERWVRRTKWADPAYHLQLFPAQAWMCHVDAALLPGQGERQTERRPEMWTEHANSTALPVLHRWLPLKKKKQTMKAQQSMKLQFTNSSPENTTVREPTVQKQPSKKHNIWITFGSETALQIAQHLNNIRFRNSPSNCTFE